MKAIIHTDASCRVSEFGGTAPMRIGYFIQTEAGTRVASVGQVVFGMTGEESGTINMAEYLGLIHAARHAIRLGFDSLQVFTDSQLMARQLSGMYRIKSSRVARLAREAKELGRIVPISVTWNPREKNTEADALAKRTIYEEMLAAEMIPGQSSGRYPRTFTDWQATLIRQWFEKTPDLNEGTVARIFAPRGVDEGQRITAIRQIRKGMTYANANLDKLPNWDKIGDAILYYPPEPVGLHKVADSPDVLSPLSGDPKDAPDEA